MLLAGTDRVAYGPGPMRTVLLVLLALTTLVACGGSAREEGTSSPREEGTVFSSGGESTGSEPAPVFRTTTPIPLPQPAIARESLAPAVDRVWTAVEEAVAVQPPPPPATADDASVRAWSEGPFTEWMRDRITRIEAASAASLELEGAPSHERGVVAGVLAYALEVTAAEARSVPIPDDIAADAELLAAYVEALDGVLLPFAERAAEAFLFCVAAFDETSEPAWGEWRAYCADRNADIVDSYRLGDGAARPTNDTSATPAAEASEGSSTGSGS